MKFTNNLDSFEKISFENWLSQVETQLGKPLSTLNSKTFEDIEIKAVYQNLNLEFNPNNQNECRLFEKSLLKDFDTVLYFSDYIKQGIDAITEIALVVNQFFTNIEKYNNILIVIGLNQDVYLNITKLRALRFTIDSIMSNLKIENVNYKILATVSPFNKSVLDKENNIIRQTGEVFSAVLGNADYVETLPFNLDYNDDFSERISKNIFRIIDKETYITKILDPVKGSYFFESYTKELIKKSFNLIKEFETKSSDEIFDYVLDSSEEVNKSRIDNLKTRRDKLIGVNIYSNPKDEFKLINQSGISKIFEELKLNSLNYKLKNGNSPKIYIVTFGNLAKIKARLDFISDFLQCGGFECEISNQFETIEDAITTIDLLSNPLNVICSTDDIYKEIVPELTFNLKKLNPDVKLYLAGKPIDDFKRYEELGIDNFIHLKSNIYNELKEIWQLYSI